VCVLIVEDEAIIAIGYEATLLDIGHEVVGIAADAASALRLAREQRPTIALVDMNLADGLTGNLVAAELHRRYGVHCFLITGNPELVDADVLRNSAGLLRKPVSHSDLSALVGPPPAGRVPAIAGLSMAAQSR
jgi:DNA-binding response OmpR family regulator